MGNLRLTEVKSLSLHWQVPELRFDPDLSKSKVSVRELGQNLKRPQGLDGERNKGTDRGGRIISFHQRKIRTGVRQEKEAY